MDIMSGGNNFKAVKMVKGGCPNGNHIQNNEDDGVWVPKW